MAERSRTTKLTVLGMIAAIGAIALYYVGKLAGMY